MSKLSIIEEVGRISGYDKPKENPYEIKAERERLGSPTKTTRDFLEDFRLDKNPLD
jgi:phenylalanyl-tRNA synthetase beta subunit